MAGQITWASRPAAAETKTWFRERARPADLRRWETAWFLVAHRVELDLPDIAEAEGEEAAARAARELVAELRAAMRAGQPIAAEQAQDRTVTVELGPHQFAREVVLAEMAGREDRVVAFRREHLPVGLLADDEELAEWIAARAAGELVGTLAEMFEAAQPVVVWTRFDGRSNQRPAGGNPELVALWGLAERLAKRYGWHRASAVTFVLAGGVPSAPMLTVRSNVGLSTSVTLTVHPDVPVATVATAYRTAQQTLNGPGRARLVSDEVAEAVVAASVTPGGWHDKHEVYRAARPGRVDGRSDDDFRRVVERARVRLVATGSGLDPLRRLLTRGGVTYVP